MYRTTQHPPDDFVCLPILNCRRIRSWTSKQECRQRVKNKEAGQLTFGTSKLLLCYVRSVHRRKATRNRTPHQIKHGLSLRDAPDDPSTINSPSTEERSGEVIAVTRKMHNISARKSLCGIDCCSTRPPVTSGVRRPMSSSRGAESL